MWFCSQVCHKNVMIHCGLHVSRNITETSFVQQFGLHLNLKSEMGFKDTGEGGAIPGKGNDLDQVVIE